jgi:hypothetical protein
VTLPTDHGIVVIRDDGSGMKTVLVCAGFRDGEPVDAFAMHYAVPDVEVHAGVNFVALHTGAYRGCTSALATVFRDDDVGTVHVLPPARGRGLLDP